MADVEPDARFWEILRSLLPEVPIDATVDLDLWQHGMDSLVTVQLMVELEQSYAFEFDDDQLGPDTFATPATLWSAVASRRVAQ